MLSNGFWQSFGRGLVDFTIHPNPKPAIYLKSLDYEAIRHEGAAFLLLEQVWLLVFMYHLYARFTPPLTGGSQLWFELYKDFLHFNSRHITPVLKIGKWAKADKLNPDLPLSL